MASNNRYKYYLVLILLVISALYLIPSLFNFKAIREQAEKSGEPLPWYVKLSPEDQINLGLDLQGGIYLEVEVLIQDAIFNQMDLMADSLEGFLKEKNEKFISITRIPRTDRLRARLVNEQAFTVLKQGIKERFPGELKTLEESPELIYELSAADNEAKKSLYDKLIQWTSKRSDILDLERQANDVFLVLGQEVNLEFIKQEIAKEFGDSLKTKSIASLHYLEGTTVFKDRLRERTIKHTITSIRNRIDRHGVTEPSITQVGNNRIAIELPGESDPERALAVVMQSGKLEFKMVDDSLNQDQVKLLVDQVRKEKNIPNGASQEIIDQINLALKGKIPEGSEISFEIQRDPTKKKISKMIPYLLKKKAEITGDMLKDARVNIQKSKASVGMTLNNTGKKIFGDLTTQNTGRFLAILLDGYINSAPRINEPIMNGSAEISFGTGKNLQATLHEAEDLVVVLKEGALPAGLKKATSTVIGPSLGKSSIDKGMMATAAAGLLIIVFMFIYYKQSGIIADLSLLVNIMFILAILAIFGATLTLPGVAGLVLTLGMAVDANVIIFERIKEELADGKKIVAAVDQGFKNAMSAILDANVTTFGAGFILYQFGSGPVKGFAVTLMIGIVTTLFTAIFLTRLGMDSLFIQRQVKKLSI